MKRKLLLVGLSCCFLLTSCAEKRYSNNQSQTISDITVTVNEDLTIKGKEFALDSYSSMEYGETYASILGGTLKIEVESTEKGEVKKVDKNEYRLTTTYYTVQMNITGVELDSATKQSIVQSLETSINLSSEDTKKLVNGDIVEVELDEDDYRVNYILVDDEYLTFKVQ